VKKATQTGKQEQKSRFIELRAKGHSLARCAKELSVAKGTVCNWGQELAQEIARAKSIEMETLMEEFGMLKEARISFLGKQLEAVRGELESRGLDDVSTTKLLEMQLTYFKELMAEAIETEPPTQNGSGTETGAKLNAADIAEALQDVYVRRRAGALSAKEAKEELAMLEALRKAHDQAILEEKYGRIESILEGRN